MLYTQDIFQRAYALLAKSGEPDHDLLMEVSSLSESEFTSRLKAGIDTKDFLDLFIRSCALLAVSFYLQFGESSDYSSISVGNVSISKRSSDALKGTSQDLRSQAESLLRPYLHDSGFLFKGVRG